jgi:hypothetical protein
VFRPDYPGFASARGVIEAPNGDPSAKDTAKRYSHVATKYLNQIPHNKDRWPWAGCFGTLIDALERAHDRA